VEPAVLEFYLVPRFTLMLIASAAVFGIGLAFARWPFSRLGWIVGFLAIAFAVFSVWAPQPLAQLLAAMQPGLGALALFLLGKWSFAAMLRRRVERLPAFSRVPLPVPPPSVRENGSRPSRNPLDAVISPRSPSASKG
jgi:hypothetical protein